MTTKDGINLKIVQLNKELTCN